MGASPARQYAASLLTKERIYMNTVLLCALGVGGATVIGSLIGFLFRTALERHTGKILSLAAGIMLCAAVTNLIAPSVEGADAIGITLAALGIFVGAVTLYCSERVLPSVSYTEGNTRSAILFAIAMAIHNLPEGMAAGLGFGTGDISDAIAVAFGIALHNIPEGMIAIFPMLSAGIKPLRAFLFALSGGVAEVIGTFLGHFSAGLAKPILPFALAFAGGTMLYVVFAEMVPDSQPSGRRRVAFLVIFGYLLMLSANALISSP